jgi:hypothetical protein
MKQFVFAAILALGASLFLISPVSALTVSPVRFEIQGDPGQTLFGEIELHNEQAITRTFYSSFENFEARGEGGEPRFVPGRTGLAAWIETEPRIVLEPEERKKIPFSINIPLNADPGGHFAAIFFGTAPPEQAPGQEGVVVGARIGVLVLLSVAGEIKEGGGIAEFGTENRFFTSLPVAIFYRFANDSGDRIMPRGEIKIRNTIGMKTAVLDANPVLGNILPGSVRRFEAKWGEEEKEQGIGFWGTVGHQWRNFAFGAYSANLNLSWQEGVSAKANARFFVIPWQLLSVMIVILVIAGFFAVIGIRKYNRWIISKAMAGRQD